MEVTKDEQRKLDDLFRKIADRDEFVARQRQAAETLRRKEAEPPVTVWVVVDNYTLRDWGKEGFAIRGIYLTLDEAVAHIHAEYDRHKTEGPLLPIEGKGENTRWYYDEWDEAHIYGIEQAPILSTFKTEGQPLPEDSVIFQNGVEEGRRLEREEQKPTPDWMPKFLDELRSKKHYFDWDEHRDIEGHILAIIKWIAPDYFNRKEKGQKPLPGFDNLTPDEKMNHPLYLEGFDTGREVGRVEAEQKPEWSEEDSSITEELYEYFSYLQLTSEKEFSPSLSIDEILKWLKSLKNRGNFLKSNTNSSTKEGQR